MFYMKKEQHNYEQDYQNKINEQKILHLKRLKEIREKNALNDENNNV